MGNGHRRYWQVTQIITIVDSTTLIDFYFMKFYFPNEILFFYVSKPDNLRLCFSKTKRYDGIGYTSNISIIAKFFVLGCELITFYIFIVVITYCVIENLFVKHLSIKKIAVSERRLIYESL